MMRVRRLATVLALGSALVAGPAALVAQDDSTIDPEEENRLLREAAGLEWRGRTDDAERVLTGLLDRWPTSSGGLFSLERILRSRSRAGLVLPYADRYLEADPTASGVRYMKLRVLVEIDSLAALDATAGAWFDAEPNSAEPYREVARLYARAFGDERALEVLERGRRALPDSDDSLAMEIGDLRSRLGDDAGAVREWSVAVRRTDVDPEVVLPRAARLGEDAASLLGPLFDALQRAPSTPAMRATAVRLAIQLGDAPRAEELARTTLADLPVPDAIEFLSDLAQRADEAELPALALWALRAQRERMGNRDARTLDVRIASAALAVGDTATALAAQTRLARALPAGSVERRRVIADLIRVEAPTASVATLRERLSGFAREFSSAPELDELTALVAAAIAARGEPETALAVLGPAVGPRSSLERAFLHLGAGELEAGRESLESALPALAPSRATEGIQLLELLDRLQPGAGAVLARTAAEQHWGDPVGAATTLATAAEQAAEVDRPALYAQAARWAEEAGMDDLAASWLAVVVTSFGESPEHAEAIYRLARLRAADPTGLAEARALLQQLILDRPNSPIVPAARRELQRIGRGDR